MGGGPKLALERALSDDHEAGIGKGVADPRRSTQEVGETLVWLEVRNGTDDGRSRRNPELPPHAIISIEAKRLLIRAVVQGLDGGHPPEAQTAWIADGGSNVI